MCQNFAHNFPTMSSRLSIRGATTTSLSVDSSKTQRDEVSKIQQDINIIVQKIAELNGEPAPLGDSDNSSVNSASPFVVGLRSLADTERKFKDVKDLKLTTLEKLLEKISEYDRLLLKETAPVVDPTVVPLRRKSFGQDLHYLPTHLHLTARLMDLHSSSKRVTVIKTTEPGSGGAASGTPPLNPSDKKLIDGLKATVAKQTKQLEDAEARSSHSQEENQQLKRTNEELKTQVQALQIKPAAAAAPTVVVDPKSAQQQEENQQLKRTNEELKAQLLSLLSKPAPPIMPSNDSEVAALKARVLELERHTDTLQQRLEVEVGNYQGMVSVALGKASRINNHVDLDGKGDDCVNLVSTYICMQIAVVCLVITLLSFVTLCFCSLRTRVMRTTRSRRRSPGAWTG
jgi:cell division protein FtsB